MLLVRRLKKGWSMFPASVRSVGLTLSYFLQGCAYMHHYQLSDIDSSHGQLRPISVQVNDVGFNLNEATALLKSMETKSQAKRTDTASDFISMFQYGPSTGDLTFNDTWGDRVSEALLARCPTGEITGVTTQREHMDYPVLSGEIITVKGYCVQ
jgi:hypothetical protein